MPRYGFGDPTSIRLIEAVCGATKECGAIRHGAECFNWLLPQEMEEDFLVVWDRFDDKPWRYKSQGELISFLLERIEQGYSFPLHPVWVVRDPGWYQVYDALQKSPAAQGPLQAWFPPQSGIREKVDSIHKALPDGWYSPASRENRGSKKKQLPQKKSPFDNEREVPELDHEEELDLAVHSKMKPQAAPGPSPIPSTAETKADSHRIVVRMRARSAGSMPDRGRTASTLNSNVRRHVSLSPGRSNVPREMAVCFSNDTW